MKQASAQIATQAWLHHQTKLTIERERIQAIKLWPPPLPEEDCPLCLARLPLDSASCPTYSTYFPCCGKVVCTACQNENVRAVEMMKKKKKDVDFTCAFCRAPSPKDDDELLKRFEERVQQGDASATLSMAYFHKSGMVEYGSFQVRIPMNRYKSIELYHRAADMGNTDALVRLYSFYQRGAPGVRRCKGKGLRYLEMAAKMGSVAARNILGYLEVDAGNFDLACIHFCSTAKLGDEDSVEELWKLVRENKMDKAALEDVLQEHDIAQDKMKSEHRERHYACVRAHYGRDNTLKNVYSAYYRGKITAIGLNEALKAKENGVWNKQELARALLANSVK